MNSFRRRTLLPPRSISIAGYAGSAGVSAAQRRGLLKALAAESARYDPAERMIRRRFSSPGYHTTLTGGMVHPTRDSLAYAVALMDSGEDAWRRHASCGTSLPRPPTTQQWSPTQRAR